MLGNANQKDKTKRLEDLHVLLQASLVASHLQLPWKEPSDCSPLKHSWCAPGLCFPQLVHPTQSITLSQSCCFSPGCCGGGSCKQDPSPKTLLPSSSSTNVPLPKTGLGNPFSSVPRGSSVQPAYLFWQDCASWGGVSTDAGKAVGPSLQPYMRCRHIPSPGVARATFLGQPRHLPQLRCQDTSAWGLT